MLFRSRNSQHGCGDGQWQRLPHAGHGASELLASTASAMSSAAPRARSSVRPVWPPLECWRGTKPIHAASSRPAHTKSPQFRDETSERLAGQCRHIGIIDILQPADEIDDAVPPHRCNDSEFSKVAAQRIDQHSTLPYQQVAHAMMQKPRSVEPPTSPARSACSVAQQPHRSPQRPRHLSCCDEHLRRWFAPSLFTAYSSIKQ